MGYSNKPEGGHRGEVLRGRLEHGEGIEVDVLCDERADVVGAIGDVFGVEAVVVGVGEEGVLVGLR